MKRSFWLISAALIILTATMLALASGPRNAIIEQKIIALALDNGLGLRFSGFRPKLIGIAAEQAWILPRGTFFGLELEQTDLSLPFFSLLTLEPQAQIHAKFYQGDLQAIYSPMSSGAIVSLNLTRAQISEHPQLSALGISSGELSLQADNLELAPGKFPVGKGVLQLMDLSTRHALQIPSQLSAGMQIVLPAFKSISVACNLESNIENITLSDLNIESDEHGKLSGFLKAQLNQRGIDALEGELDLELNTNALALFSIMRGLYGSTKTDNTALNLNEVKRWHVSAAGRYPPKIEYTPLK